MSEPIPIITISSAILVIGTICILSSLEPIPEYLTKLDFYVVASLVAILISAPLSQIIHIFWTVFLDGEISFGLQRIYKIKNPWLSREKILIDFDYNLYSKDQNIEEASDKRDYIRRKIHAYRMVIQGIGAIIILTVIYAITIFLIANDFIKNNIEWRLALLIIISFTLMFYLFNKYKKHLDKEITLFERKMTEDKEPKEKFDEELLN